MLPPIVEGGVGDETALVQRHPMKLVADPYRWIVGIMWDKKRSRLWIMPVPMLAIVVHLPAHTARLATYRWVRAHLAMIMLALAFVMLGVGAYVLGRYHGEAPASNVAPTIVSGAAVPSAVAPLVPSSVPPLAAPEPANEPATLPVPPPSHASASPRIVVPSRPALVAPVNPYPIPSASHTARGF